MDKNEFISLVLPLKDRLFRVAWCILRSKEEAEDIVQDVMLKVWRDEKGKVENLAAYCYTMARNLALNRLVLKDNRSKELEGAYEQEVQEQPLENIIRTEKMKLLYRMIDGLPGLQRDVVQLRDMEGLSYRDIAKTLQVTEEQVKVNLFRARKKIKTWILMDYDRIIGLLDKYWKCETTLPEEEELRYFYKHCRQMPEELAEYRELFIFQEGERQIGLGNDFDRKILASIYNKRPAGWRKGLRVAAVLLLLIGVSQVLIDIGNPQKDTCQTPEQALAEVRQALNFVSSKMNRGQQLLEENMDEMKWINRYIK